MKILSVVRELFRAQLQKVERTDEAKFIGTSLNVTIIGGEAIWLL
jgi:hypothetical protein